MSKLIVIIGITGTQGGSVADTFSSIPGWRIRGITRNPESSSAQALSARGLEVVKADLDDKESLIAAFQDAHAIFAVTDFWQHFQNPGNFSKAVEAGTTINQYAFDLEVAQGINIADAAAEASVLKTLDRFVFSSLSDVKRWSKRKYTWVYHFDSKAKIEDHIKNKLPKLAAKMSTVQMGYYVNNANQFPLGPQKQEDGTITFSRAESDNAPIPFVVTQRDTGSFVKALVELPAGKNLLGVSETMTWEKLVQTWAEVTGATASIKWFPMENLLADIPPPLARELDEMVQYSGEFGWTGGDPDVVTIEQLGVDIPVTSVAEWIKEEDWSSVIN